MSDDVLITPASRKIEFKDNSGNVDGKIELDSNGNLNITSPGGDIGIGDTTADVFIGDGTNNVDIVFEQNGEIRGLAGKTLTIGQADSNVTVTAQNFAVTDGMTLDGGNLILGDDAYSTSASYVGMKTSAMTGNNDYMIISAPGVDNSTYISAKAGNDVFIRGGGNANPPQIQLDTSAGDIVMTGDVSISGSITAGSGLGGGGFTEDSTTKNLSAGTRANNQSNSNASSAMYNIALGQDANAGPSGSSGGLKNVAIGYEALKVNTDSYETAVGHQALVARTNGTFPCAAFGNLAGYRVTSGSANTYLGVYNYGCTTGQYNTAVGAFNHGNMTSGSGNVAVGYKGGLDITTGDYNVTIGYLAGADITTGDDNTFIGREAGEKVTTGEHNIAIGERALEVATAVYDVVAIGRSSMSGAAPGNSNVGVGKLTGNNLTSSANQNTFIGAHAGQYMTTGSLNTFIGAYDGNVGGLDLRTSDRNIVLSDGAANARLYYTHADSSWKSAEIYATTTGDSANMVSLSSGTIARSTSALKYKQDIRDLEEMNIGLLRPVRYKSKCAMDDQTKDHLGIIADEAASSGFEELVTYGADNEVEGFQYERLTVVLLKKIQALEARIATLEAK